MIDLKKLRDDDNYRTGALNKGVEASTIERVLSLDGTRRDALAAAETLRAESNAASKEIGRAAPDERQAKIDAAGELKTRLTEAEATLNSADEQLTELSLTIPNPAHDSVPVGGEEDYRVEVEVGEKSPPPPYDHGTLGEMLGIVDTERAVRMSGSRFAYV
ncbi:MAG: serine--tRNA ligase, partial [Acidimicrobiales bacterium]